MSLLCTIRHDQQHTICVWNWDGQVLNQRLIIEGVLLSCLVQGYWQSAIAAKPSAAHTGYLMGGLMWFCIPFTLATTMGLAALALDLPVTIAEAGSGVSSLQLPS